MPNVTLKTVDAFSVMKNPKSRLIKFGPSGYAGLRNFTISANNHRIEWDSSDKGAAWMNLDEIDEIVFGQITDNFHKRHAPRDVALVSFSLINGNKSLDLVAPTCEEFEVWTEGLAQLIKRIKAEKAALQAVDPTTTSVAKLKELPIVIPVPSEVESKEIVQNVTFYLTQNLYM